MSRLLIHISEVRFAFEKRRGPGRLVPLGSSRLRVRSCFKFLPDFLSSDYTPPEAGAAGT